MGSDQALVLVVMVEFMIVPPLSGVLLLELRLIRLGRRRGEEDASARRKDLLLSSSWWDGGGVGTLTSIDGY